MRTTRLERKKLNSYFLSIFLSSLDVMQCVSNILSRAFLVSILFLFVII